MGFVALWAAGALVSGAIVYAAWNWLLADLFGKGDHTFGQSLGISVLISLVTWRVKQWRRSTSPAR